MDIRNEFPGGEVNPTNTELNLMPNANRGGIHALGRALTDGNNAILTGVHAQIGANSVTIQEGYVFLHGEVLKVEAGTINDTVGNNRYIFQKVIINNDPAFERNYRDGSINNVAQIIRAVPTPVAALGASDLAVDGTTLNPLLQADYNETNTASRRFIRNRPRVFDITNFGALSPIDIGNVAPGSINSTGDLGTISNIVNENDITVFSVNLNNDVGNSFDYFVQFDPEILGLAGTTSNRNFMRIDYQKTFENQIRIRIEKFSSAAQFLARLYVTTYRLATFGE